MLSRRSLTAGCAAMHFLFGSSRCEDTSTLDAAPKAKRKTKAKPSADCFSPVCNDTIQNLNRAMLMQNQKPAARATAVADSKAAYPEAAGVDAVMPLQGCPASIGGLGHSTWTLLHTIAEYLPESLSQTEQERLSGFVQSLAALYPCSICRGDFVTFVEEHPPRVRSRDEFALWCCELHNDVHAKLGKPTVRCSREALRQRWYLNSEDPDCGVVLADHDKL